MRTTNRLSRTAQVSVLAVGVGVVGVCYPCHAGWLDFFKRDTATTNAVTGVAELSAGEITKGLKEALAKGVEKAVANLGRTNGFLQNLDVKIPLPPSLAQVDKALQAVHQGKYADEFVTTLNRAAETAVPQAGPIFGEAIRQMTIEDARNILQGADDAATQYLRKVGEPTLKEKMLPIVTEATGKVGVTSSYKNLMSKAGPVIGLFEKKQTLDLDEYVTNKTLDGLFHMIALEEKEIRKDPMARSTDLLKKVFGWEAK